MNDIDDDTMNEWMWLAIAKVWTASLQRIPGTCLVAEIKAAKA